MNKSQFIFILCGILVLVILVTMLEVNKTNVVGLIILFGVFSYYVWNNNANPLVGKLIMLVIAYVLIVATIGFFWNVSVEMPDFGLNLLLPQLDLNTNKIPNIVTIPVAKIDKPGSDKYTYSFSVFIPEYDAGNFSASTIPYLFFRNSSSSSTDKNIGLKLGTTPTDFNTLTLEYCTIVDDVDAVATKELTQLPVGKWTTILITVDKTLVDIYVGGNKLTKQYKIDNLKRPDVSSPIEFGYMPAYLANFSYTPYVVQPTPSFVDYLSKTDGIVV
jgi:hypothetical protein